jgi:TRAP-type C4-dicarboxylate transport system permease small subunit
MNPKLPDWMFAAFAIGAWELAELLIRQWHLMWARTGAYAIIAVCAIVLAVRYIVRFRDRLKHRDEPDPDEWKTY